MAGPHEPVMAPEAVAALGCRPGGTWVDATVGAGGHAAAILAASAPDGFLLGVDRDREILALAAARLAAFAGRFRLVHGNFGDLAAIVAGAAPGGAADGVLLDLGISSLQVDDPARGFSFRADAPLDMRMDRGEGGTALELLAEAEEEELADLIWRFGEERASRRIARAICRERGRGALTTARLAALVAAAVGGRGPRSGRIHPATRTFQALRIAVNRELEALDAALAAVPGLLAPGGRCCVIAYHSLEDRAVKRAFQALARAGAGGERFSVLTKKPVRPQAAEVAANPRARSARLRALARAA